MNGEQHARMHDPDLGRYPPRIHARPISPPRYRPDVPGPSSSPAPTLDFARPRVVPSPAPLATNLQPRVYPDDGPDSAVTATSVASDLTERITPPSPARSAEDAETEEATTSGRTTSPSKGRKHKKGKEQLPLAPDQPLTTQGTSRQRVYLACSQCRSRKIRCDGTKPACNHCIKRGIPDCLYDTAPKRRGPDRVPGARQRFLTADGEHGVEPARSRHRRKDTAPYVKEPAPGKLELIFEEYRMPLPEEPLAPPTPIAPLAPCAQQYYAQHAQDFSGERTENARIQPTEGYRVSPVEDYPHSPVDVKEPDIHAGGIVIPDAGTFMNAFFGIQNHTSAHEARDSYGAGPSYNQHTTAYYPHPNTSAYITSEEDDAYQHDEEHQYHLALEPSMDFARKTWWDNLLSLYHAPDVPAHLLGPLTFSQRETTAHTITADLRWLWRRSNYWFAFMHVPTFFGRLFDPAQHAQMQPALVLGALALATFLQSSEAARGEDGRRMALRLREEAQISLEASVTARWIDEDLAQAAWLMAMFEVCAHPMHSTQRSRDAMLTLDSIIRVLALTSLDAHEPHVTTYASRGVLPPLPSIRRSIGTSSPYTFAGGPLAPSNVLRQLHSLTDTHAARTAHASPHTHSGAGACSCAQLSLGASAPRASEHTPLWLATARWSDDWSAGEVRKEACRRLCWSALALAAGHTSYGSPSTGGGLDLAITDPANWALFFNGEATTRALAPVGAALDFGKETVWALYNRVTLLWHSCLRMRANAMLSEPEKAQFAMAAWLELDGIERALNAHTCDLEKSFMFQGREIIFNSRMVISYEYQKFIPDATTNFNGFFHRAKAEEWLRRQLAIAQGLMHGLGAVTGLASNRLAERPFMVFWFMAQISRALMLWRVDTSMTLALDVADAWLGPTDYLTALWPCQTQRERYDALRQQIAQANAVAGRQPPRALDVSRLLPAILHTLI